MELLRRQNQDDETNVDWKIMCLDKKLAARVPDGFLDPYTLKRIWHDLKTAKPMKRLKNVTFRGMYILHCPPMTKQLN